MRKLSLLIIALTSFTFSGLSQDGSAGGYDKFRFGLHFSPNLGWTNPSNQGMTKNGNRFGFAYGLMAEFGLSPRYAIFTGVNVIKINTSTNYNFPTAAGSFDINQQYVEIPLALKLKTNEIGYFTYFGKFGLSNAYNIKSRREDLDVDRSFDSETQPLRFALLVGLGLEYSLSGSTRLVTGIDFNNGFSGMYTKKAGSDASGNKYKAINNCVALTLGIYF